MSTGVELNKTTPQDAAQGRKASPANTFEGKVVSITGDKLVMTNKEGKEYSHTVAKDARLTCDEATCKSEDLKAGRRIRVTTAKDDRNVATRIESLDKNPEFAQCS